VVQGVDQVGQILEYGNTGDSRIEAQANPPQSNPTVRVWALNKISDKKGNYLTVTYAEDNANGDFYPIKIEYNWNTGLHHCKCIRAICARASYPP